MEIPTPTPPLTAALPEIALIEEVSSADMVISPVEFTLLLSRI